MERTEFFGRMYIKSKKLDKTNILDDFNCNINLNIGIQNIKSYKKKCDIDILYHPVLYIRTG